MSTAQPEKTPTTAKATTCPHCRGDLASTQTGKHCPATNRHCAWIRCRCGATVDLRRGLHDHPTHHNQPQHAWPCEGGAR